MRRVLRQFALMEKMKIYSHFLGAIFIINSNLYGQSNNNCFLVDARPKTAVIPKSVNAEKPAQQASVIVAIQGDTIGKISKYVFGNAIAAWAGAHDNSTLVANTRLLAPSLIRFPGGSWSDGYFWNKKIPSDVPDSIYDGTSYNPATKTAKKGAFGGHDGTEGWVTTTDQYYTLRKNTNVAEGLITINYGYARYGTGNNPVAQAAHLAADWVRYDAGRTKFWEIGNENGGPWEYGWMIDTNKNKDGQPQIITGALYGKHFKVFVDSMKKAAKQIGDTIYIGGQILASEPTPGYMWYFVDKPWNEGFLKEVGDSADFYVVHNYISGSTDVKTILTDAETALKANMDYIKQDILNKNGYLKPVALTEYNMGGGTVTRAASYINGMQAVVLISELIKNNFGLGARWLLVSGETTMFYGGSDARYLNHPHAEFYYLTYLQKFCGDHAISTASSNSDILCYASKYSSGETGVVIVNKGTTQQVIRIDPKSIGLGKKYYIYSFTGGTDNGDFSQNVYINGNGPSTNQWGPFEGLSDIKANSYDIGIGNEIKFASPGRSIQMIMIEGENGPNFIRAGKNPLCQGDSGITFSIPQKQGVRYKWTYSGTGATIDNDTLHAININFSNTATSGTLTVNAKYPADSTWTLDVTVGTPVAQPSVVTSGKDPVCRGDNNIIYSVTNDPAMAYNWTYSGTGATISNDSTNAISVNYGSAATSGTLTITASNNGCSNSRTTTVTVNSLPTQPSLITASKSPVCLGDNGITYFVTKNTAVTYNWTYSGTGATIANGTTNSISIDYDSLATSGTLKVTATNSSGCVNTRALAVTVKALPVQPTAISASKNPVVQGDNGITYSVTKDSAVTYKWKYSGTGATISNGTTNIISVNYSSSATSGNMSVTAKNASGCASSNTLAVTVNSMPNGINSVNADDLLSVNYNSGKSEVLVSYRITDRARVKIEIFNMQGRLIKRLEDSFKAPGSYDIHSSINDPAKGVYIVRYNAGKVVVQKKLLIY